MYDFNKAEAEARLLAAKFDGQDRGRRQAKLLPGLVCGRQSGKLQRFLALLGRFHPTLSAITAPRNCSMKS
jgi:hypothetical protein